jgi:hypothetical protein
MHGQSRQTTDGLDHFGERFEVAPLWMLRVDGILTLRGHGVAHSMVSRRGLINTLGNGEARIHEN